MYNGEIVSLALVGSNLSNMLAVEISSGHMVIELYMIYTSLHGELV